MTSLWHYVRRAVHSDLVACDQIARTVERKWKGSLGWVRKDSLQDGINKQSVHVAVLDDKVVGFVYFTVPSRGKNEGWNVIHALAVHPDVQARGIGRSLLYSVPTPIRLLCPETVNGDEKNPANQFYRSAGILHVGYSETVSTGKRLNRWELRVLPMLVRGGNKAIPPIARKSGWAYGLRGDYIPFDYPFHIDIPFEQYHKGDDLEKALIWQHYMEMVHEYHPVSALVADYTKPKQKATMLAQVEELRVAGVIRVMVCPKFAEAVADIPADCVVAISIPSGYSGYIPPLETLRGRKIHLLGGTPPKWFGGGEMAVGYVELFTLYGVQIVSADANVHVRAGYVGECWRGNGWNNDGRRGNGDLVAIESGQNIRVQLNAEYRERHTIMEGM